MKWHMLFAWGVIAPLLFAGDSFSTKDNIKARGIDLTITVPEGLTRIRDESKRTVQAWTVKTQGLHATITLSMSKHNMHTQEEKMAEFAKNTAPEPAEKIMSSACETKSISSTSKKIGNEPAAINEYECMGTWDNGKKWRYYVLRLDLYPGDTWISVWCHVGREEYNDEPLEESISAIRPALIKMLNSVTLN